MANVNTDAVLTRVREVLEGDASATRAVALDTYLANLPPGLVSDEQSRRAMVNPRYDVRVVSLKPHPSMPPTGSSLGLYTLELEVVTARQLTLIHNLSDTRRDDVAALAAVDGDVISQALCYPFNLFQTLAGTLTYLVNGCLKYDSSSLTRFEVPADGPGIIETTHRFHGVFAIDR